MKTVPLELYPDKLLDYKEKYSQIWYDGDLGLLKKTLVSVVGSRNVSENGVIRTRNLIKLLVDQDYVVVSGLADGVDTIAHETTLALNGKTIAVMGTSIKEIYPKNNLSLKNEIIKNGLVLSQFRPGTPVQRYNFPKRNDLMAILSQITIVVEAGEGSGTRHQIESSIKYGKLVAFTKSLADSNINWVNKALENKNSIILSDEKSFIDKVSSYIDSMKLSKKPKQVDLFED